MEAPLADALGGRRSGAVIRCGTASIGDRGAQAWEHAPAGDHTGGGVGAVEAPPTRKADEG